MIEYVTEKESLCSEPYRQLFIDDSYEGLLSFTCENLFTDSLDQSNCYCHHGENLIALWNGESKKADHLHVRT
jgi:hypothetical protein